MIILQKATTNTDTIIRKLKAFTTLNNPYYLFVFTSPMNVQYTCIGTDLATVAQQESFSNFTIIEGVDDRTNGSLILGNTGVYDFEIYEQASSTNLDPNNATRIEYSFGLARVKDSEVSNYVAHEIDVTYAEHSI